MNVYTGARAVHSLTHTDSSISATATDSSGANLSLGCSAEHEQPLVYH